MNLITSTSRVRLTSGLGVSCSAPIKTPSAVGRPLPELSDTKLSCERADRGRRRFEDTERKKDRNESVNKSMSEH